MSQQAAGQQAAGGYPPDMIRPERIAGIPMLNADRKAFYTEGLTKLWAALENNARGSENYNKAFSKIKEVSRDIMRQVANWKASQGQQRPPPQNQQQAQQQPQAPNQPQQPPQPAQQQQPVQQPVQPTPQPPTQQQQQPPQMPQQPQSQPAPQSQLGQQARTFLNNFKVFPPTNIIPNTPDYENYKRRIMNTLSQLVTMQESSVARFQQCHEKITSMESSGTPPDSQTIQARDSARAGVSNAKSKIDSIRSENERNRLAWADKTRTQSQNNPQAQNTAPFAAAANNATQPMSPAVPANYQQNSNVPMHPQQQQQQQQQPQQQQQQQQQPIARPPVPQQPYQSPAAQGPPQPLTHSAAISQAQRTYSEQQGQGQNTPTPGSSQPFSHAQNATLNVSNNKFQIPKQLPPPQNQPVAMGPARPTFGGPSNGAPGMMGQPAVQKTPHFILEGEGDRVLSKKKLDELVRQVTGGGDGDGLTTDVEEAVLSLADDFVDNVITAACRLAKIRPNSTLDIRDIQIILERNYNIRVPGYSLDEVRTVRKFQPAAGWTQKMNAVQAAKVMGKNDS